jgi:hypothetical protein
MNLSGLSALTLSPGRGSLPHSVRKAENPYVRNAHFSLDCWGDEPLGSR